MTCHDHLPLRPEPRPWHPIDRVLPAIPAPGTEEPSR
jgi:hypothetical protein